MKKYIKTGYLTIITLCALFPFAHASAATVYVESSRSTVSVGDTFIVAVKINSDGAVLNAVDGGVGFTSSSAGSISIQAFGLGNSIFGLWPQTPSVSKDGLSVTFSGGVPGGFSIEGATMFKIAVLAKKAGTITINPQNMSVFANDGKGTKIPAQLKNIVVNVIPQVQGKPVQDDWSSTISEDTIPPEDFIIVLGQDNSILGGKKFAYFSAVDNQSGIDHYDVSEDGKPAVRSGSMYELQDQSDNVNLVVTAYDKAGNKKVALYPISTSKPISWPTVILGTVIIVLGYFIFKKMKKNKHNDSSSAK